MPPTLIEYELEPKGPGVYHRSQASMSHPLTYHTFQVALREMSKHSH